MNNPDESFSDSDFQFQQTDEDRRLARWDFVADKLGLVATVLLALGVCWVAVGIGFVADQVVSMQVVVNAIAREGILCPVPLK